MWRLEAVVEAVLVISTLTVAVNTVEIKRIPVVAVSGVKGGSAALPCDVSHPSDDAIYLLLWFREPLTTPIYRLDERSDEQTHWSDETQLGRRAMLEMTSSPAMLRVVGLTKEDQGLYTCRVDFRLHPTKTTRVNLTVVVPPESVSVMIGDLENLQGTASSQVGPYLEGEMLKLTCVAHGGSPRPTVVWYGDAHLLDSEMESDISVSHSEALGVGHLSTLGTGPPGAATSPLPPPPRRAFEGEAYNTLTLGPLTRSHLQVLLTCKAFNSNLTQATSSSLSVDMNLAPLSVEIRPPRTPALRAGIEYVVECVAVGARPPPSITWWSGDRRVLSATLKVSEDNNVTTSSVGITPRPEDNGSFLRCIVETHAAPAILEASWNLTVHYVPKASCSFGASLDSSIIKEGDDVYFECKIEANPRATRVSWRHNDKPLDHDVPAGVIISNQSLVLQKVVRAQAGRYTCHAHNLVGDGGSNSLRLDIKYAPVCSLGQLTTYAVGRYEDAEVTCSVDANPLQESFQWTFNNTADTIDVPQGRFTSLSSHSVITYTPMTALDYGTLLCWATNEIGTQKEPCVFHIVPAGKPEPPGNCRVGEGTRTSVRVRCESGGSGGLPQHFHLQASLYHGHHHLNLTAISEPDFHMENLQMEGKYQLVITAVNDKGSSPGIHLTVSSIGSNGSVYQYHDGPLEAEVRDGGKNGAKAEGPEASDGESLLDTLVLPSFIMGVLGVGSGLVLLVILLLLFITFHKRRAPQPLPLTETLHHTTTSETLQETNRSPRCVHNTSVLTTESHDVLHERDVTTSVLEFHQVETENDADPDVIPLQESSCRGCEMEMAPASTLLPSDCYSYAQVPGIHPVTTCIPACHHHHHHHHHPQV